jgi:5-oxopent-3-ene-1,2,5-tricarboxylate decarboxylase / 2-hydroxyhepta-2,4-diene-1,7-dioate isomerase
VSISLRTVYGTLLNSQAEFEAWAAKMNEAPYKAAPKAPVLYIKPANTWSENGADIAVPPSVAEVEIGATVAMVMKSANEVAGYLLMNDLSMPHSSYFRPPVRFKCLDGFLGIGSEFVTAADDVDPAKFQIEVRIDGSLAHKVDFSKLVRDPRRLLADVSEFMTLASGDALMLGLGNARPTARAGSLIEISAGPLGTLTNRLVAGAA